MAAAQGLWQAHQSARPGAQEAWQDVRAPAP